MDRHRTGLVLRGILAVVIAIVAFLIPAAAAYALLLIFGLFAAMDGIFALVAATKTHVARGALIAEAILGIACAALVLVLPAVSLYAAAIVVGAWAFVSGIAQIVTATRLGGRAWLYGIAGIVSIIFGVLVAFEPAIGILYIAYAFAFMEIIAAAAYFSAAAHRGALPPGAAIGV